MKKSIYKILNYDDKMYFSNRVEFGLLIFIIGLQLLNALKNIFPGVELVNLFMIISCLSVIDYNNLIRFKFPRFNKYGCILILLQIVMIIYALAAQNQSIKLYYYHFYVIAIIFGLSTQSREKVTKNLLQFLFYASGFISLVVFWQATNNGTELITSYNNTGKLWLEYGGDPVTMSRALEIYIILMLIYRSRSVIEKTLKMPFLVAAVIGLFSFGNRATIVGCILIFIVYLKNTQRTKLTIELLLKRMIFCVVIVISLVGLYKYNVYFAGKINTSIKSTITAVSTYFGNVKNGKDLSASTRVTLRKKVINTINNKFSIENYLFGYGYNSIYIDMPILQAFFDLGICGWLIYITFTIYIPIAGNISKSNDRFQLFLKLFSIQTILDQFYCGLPYYYFVYTPAILIFMIKYPQLVAEKGIEGKLIEGGQL